MQYYKQCRLVKGKTLQVAFIPEQFAKQGSFVRIKDDDGWKVEKVGVVRKDEQYLVRHARPYLPSISGN